jgi:hypothetical protein
VPCFVCPVSVSASAPDYRYHATNQEHYREEERDFPRPRDWRDRDNGQPEADHANSNQGTITLLEASLFTSRHRFSSADV